ASADGNGATRRPETGRYDAGAAAVAGSQVRPPSSDRMTEICVLSKYGISTDPSGRATGCTPGAAGPLIEARPGKPGAWAGGPQVRPPSAETCVSISSLPRSS